MQVTITVPDALAAEAEARGVALPAIPGPARKLNREELRASLDALARYSAEVPSLPDEAFSRESFYEDHD
jgi:hypothetical protein